MIFMQATLINLAMNMRLLGSNFTLTFAVFLSSGFSFLVSLTIARFFGLSLSTFELLESIPFIVVAIGFEKPFHLTKSVYQAAETLKEKEPFREKIFGAVLDVAPSILMDYFFEFSVLLAGSLAGTDGTVGRICGLAALIISMDAIFLFTFYLAVLSLKLELRRMYMSDVAKVKSSKENAVYIPTKPLSTQQLAVSIYDSKTLSGNLMDRAKFIAILTFVVGHIISASGKADLSSMTATSASFEQASFLLPLENSNYLIRVGKPHILNPTWLPQPIKTIIPIVPSGPSLINPHTVLLLCISIALLACIAVVALSQTWSAERSQVTTEKVTYEKTISIATCPLADTLPRTDSGTDINDELYNLMEKLKSEGVDSLVDSEILRLVDGGKIASYALEKVLGDYTRAVKIRRDIVCKFHVNN